MRWRAVAGILAGFFLVLSGGAVANASGNYWWDYHDLETIYWASGPNQLQVSPTLSTSISTANHCNGSGFCEHQLPNGKCLQWDYASNTVYGNTCSGVDSQLWEISEPSSGHWTWDNDYADIYFFQHAYCSAGSGIYLAPFLTAESSSIVDMRCPQSGGFPSTAQKWGQN
jgi:hypothetical protein